MLVCLCRLCWNSILAELISLFWLHTRSGNHLHFRECFCPVLSTVLSTLYYAKVAQVSLAALGSSMEYPQIDTTYASTQMMHLDFWFSWKMCKNAWSHIWGRKRTHFPQPSVWFMIPELFPHPLFENWPEQEWKKHRSEALERLELGISGSNAWHGLCCQHLRCVMHFKFSRDDFDFDIIHTQVFL